MMRRRTNPVILAACLTVPATAQDSTTTQFSVRIDHLRLHSVGYPDGVTDEGALLQWLDRRGRHIADLAERTPDKDLQRFRIAAAVNWSLARQCEPALSRMLNGTSLPDDRPFVRELAGSCLARLEALRESLQSDPPRPTGQPVAVDEPGEEAPDDGRSPPGNDDADSDAADGAPVDARDLSLVDAVEMLTVFARAIEAAASDSPERDQGGMDQAALNLSFYLEDDRPDVAAAALLWQAWLHDRSGKRDRALRILPPALTAPREGGETFDYFARLLRCRLLSDRGSYATSWALLLTLEERARDWFTTPPVQADAARSSLRVKLAICDAWAVGGSESERARTKTWCESAGRRLYDEHFADSSSATLLRLASAIPLLVEVSDEDLAALELPAPADAPRRGSDVVPSAGGESPSPGVAPVAGDTAHPGTGDAPVAPPDGADNGLPSNDNSAPDVAPR